jgi:hypothetical protein
MLAQTCEDLQEPEHLKMTYIYEDLELPEHLKPLYNDSIQQIENKGGREKNQENVPSGRRLDVSDQLLRKPLRKKSPR